MEVVSQQTRKHLSMPGLLSLVKNKFDKIPDPNQCHRSCISLGDCLSSALAIFSLKYPSLLSFEVARKNEALLHNLKSLFSVSDIPSDTYMRERLDVVEPASLYPCYKTIFAALQRGKALEQYQYLEQCYLLSLDGTGFFSSKTVHCNQCNVKHHRNGSQTYYHQLLGAAIVHPDNKVVIPLSPEAILKGDGTTKNDCERNASQRLLERVRREHPHLPLIIIEDGLGSNGPHIRLLHELNMHYILGAKPGDHAYLFDWIKHVSMNTYEHKTADGTIHRYQFVNNVPLNDANFDFGVNFLEYWEIKPNGKQQHFSWVTDIELSESNVYLIMKGGRARWRIENETFNTLKNQGYHFEHNYGHGQKNLCTNFALIMMLAFLIDQVQQLCCGLFQAALAEMERKKYLWEQMRNWIMTFCIDSWSTLYHGIIHRKAVQIPRLAFDTS